MKTGSVAQKLGIRSPKTISAWTDMFSEFFSEGARGDTGLQRDFDQNDLVVLNTIRMERLRGAEWEAIRAVLASGQRESTLPPEAVSIDGENALAVYGQLKTLELALSSAKSEIEQLRKQNEAERARYDQRETDLVQEIKALNREVGAWKARYEMLKEQMEDEENK